MEDLRPHICYTYTIIVDISLIMGLRIYHIMWTWGQIQTFTTTYEPKPRRVYANNEQNKYDSKQTNSLEAKIRTQVRLEYKLFNKQHETTNAITKTGKSAHDLADPAGQNVSHPLQSP